MLKQMTRDEEQLAKRLDELRSTAKVDAEKAARLQRQRRGGQHATIAGGQEAGRGDPPRAARSRSARNREDYKGETVELEFLRSDYDSAARIFEAINSRIVAMRLEQHAPDRVMLFKEATAPSFPTKRCPTR